MKRFVTVLTIIGILLAMTGCSFLPLDMLDDPADPEASSYQGYHLTDDPDKIVLSIADNTRIAEPTLIFSKVIDADEYQVQIANDADFLDVLFEKKSPSNIVAVDLDEIEITHHPRYWRARAFFDGEWRAWSKTGTFIYLHPDTVYFDAQGGSGIEKNEENRPAPHGDLYGSLPTNIQREGKVFDGWWTAPGGKGERIESTSTVSTDEGHILYAKWLDTYLVTYEANGNTEGTVPADQLKVQGKALSIQEHEDLSRAGYYFVCWNTKADGSGTDYYEGSSYTQDSALTLYAKWGYKNVALASNGAQASAISEGYYNGVHARASGAIDGTSEGFWASNWSMPAWLEIKFDQTYLVNAIAILWGSHRHDYSISLSENGSSWTEVLTGRSNNREGSKPVYEKFEITPRRARYLRIWITSTTAPSGHIFKAMMHEVEAYGAP